MEEEKEGVIMRGLVSATQALTHALEFIKVIVLLNKI